MNLHQVVSGAIGAINPFVTVTLRVSTGYAQSPDGAQVPAYAADVTVQAQVQSLSARDVQQINSLNLQNIQNTVYLNGNVKGIVRADGTGGDLIILGDGSVYKVAAVLEQWADWVKVAVTLQNNA